MSGSSETYAVWREPRRDVPTERRAPDPIQPSLWVQTARRGLSLSPSRVASSESLLAGPARPLAHVELKWGSSQALITRCWASGDRRSCRSCRATAHVAVAQRLTPNATGFTAIVSTLVGKWMELLTEIAPHITAAWPRQACDEAAADRIGNQSEDNREGTRFLQHRPSSGCAFHNN